MAGKWI